MTPSLRRPLPSRTLAAALLAVLASIGSLLAIGSPAIAAAAVAPGASAAAPGAPAAAAGAPAAAAGASGRPLFAPSPAVEPRLGLDSDLRLPSGISAWAIDAFLAANTPLPPLGAAFKKAEADYHVNALYLVAHAMHESDFGRSYIAQNFKNLFGWTAFDRDPVGFATRFNSFEDSIAFVAAKVAELYLDPSGAYFGGAPTLRGMYHYATDPNWAARIVDIANSMVLPTLSERGVTMRATFATDVATTGDATTITLTASPRDRLPDGLQLAGRVRGADTPPVDANGGYVLTGARSSRGSFVVPIQVGPNPGEYVMEFALVDSDGGYLPAADAIAIPPVRMRVVPLFDVGFTAEAGGGLTLRTTNNGSSAIPALGPQLGTVIAGRPPTTLVAWLVRAGSEPVELQRDGLPADLLPKASWNAVLDLGDTMLQEGDVIVTRLEVPDSTGVPQATVPGVFRVRAGPAAPTATTTTTRDIGETRAGSGGATMHLVALKADDPLAIAAVALIASPPAILSAVSAGMGLAP